MQQFIADNYTMVFYSGVFTQSGLMLDQDFATKLLKLGYQSGSKKQIV